MAISNKRKSIKYLNKNKLLKKSKKNKNKKLLKQCGGNIKYTYIHCESRLDYLDKSKGVYKDIIQCFVNCNLNEMIQLYSTKNRNIVKELSLNNYPNINRMNIKDEKKIFWKGYYNTRTDNLCYFIKGENLPIFKNLYSGYNDIDTYLVSPELVIDLITNKFLPSEYYPTNENNNINL